MKIYLKKANLKDAEKEYALVQKIPLEENGFENQQHESDDRYFIRIKL